jgi:hypothetical protein
MPDSRAGLERLDRITRATAGEPRERLDAHALGAEPGIAQRFGVRMLGRALMFGVLRTAVGILAAVLLLFHAAN